LIVRLLEDVDRRSAAREQREQMPLLQHADQLRAVTVTADDRQGVEPGLEQQIQRRPEGVAGLDVITPGRMTVSTVRASSDEGEPPWASSRGTARRRSSMVRRPHSTPVASTMAMAAGPRAQPGKGIFARPSRRFHAAKRSLP
jgi:hypothetical protein